MDEFITILKGIISRQDNDIDITPDSHLIRDLGVSSLEMMMIICKIEDYYNIKISLNDLQKAQTVLDLFNLTSCITN